MGLAICRNVAREHRGDLLVESTVGVGTTFTLNLPLRPDDTQISADPDYAQRISKFIIFSLDKGLVSKYFEEAARLAVELISLDDIRKLPEDLASFADLLICDARFSGKIELSRMAQLCLKSGVPYVMVNCGAMEYQLAHLYERALANFRELPEMNRLYALILEKSKAGPPVVP